MSDMDVGTMYYLVVLCKKAFELMSERCGHIQILTAVFNTQVHGYIIEHDNMPMVFECIFKYASLYVKI